ncbi:ras-related protein rab-30 [Anaeramoeba ignava]|uniref:Ras-related protein rab-30 n=1 Tax=Anaeramoeba ignava TaxID=1746090 RepID=A0A9Q0LRE6_ANAIG|nr:ras-related protein rab-30 [Anaeramoeba ignava]
MSFDFLFKVVLVGAAGVGKTSLINRYVDNVFVHDSTTTIGLDFKTKDIQMDDKKTRLQIWDTAGQEKYQISFSSSIYKNADVVIIVFDLTYEDSLSKVDDFIKGIENNSKKDPLFAIVGNKSDLENQIEDVEQKIEDLLKEREFKFVKTSAKEGTNVNELFFDIAKELKENQPQNQQSKTIVLKDSDNQNSKSKKKCC